MGTANILKKKYGLLTAIAMVVGIVIGSGVFFKAEKILNATQGNLELGILAWIIGGIIMISCAFVFSVMATKYEKVNGIVDYADVTVGKSYGYFIGWFMTVIYTPSITAVLAWVSARYTCVLFGWGVFGGECMVISCLYLCLSFAINTLSPRLAGKLQVSMTIIKLVPLLLMAVIGTIAGLVNGVLIDNFQNATFGQSGLGSPLLTAVVATAFAYEGWILATSINAELKDSKRNLPIALVMGTFIIMLIYLFYYIGLAGAVDKQTIMESGEKGARVAFSHIFSNVAGTGLFVLVVISCLGTLNGLMLATTRNMYAISSRNFGPNPKVFSSVDPITDMPGSSAVFGLGICSVCLLYFFGFANGWFSFFSFDISEIPIVTLYALYIPILIKFIQKEKDLGFFKRWFMPLVAMLSCLFMVYAAIISHGKSCIPYLIVFAVIMAVGMLLKDRAKRHPEINIAE